MSLLHVHVRYGHLIFKRKQENITPEMPSMFFHIHRETNNVFFSILHVCIYGTPKANSFQENSQTNILGTFVVRD